MELRLFTKDTMNDLIEMVRQTRPTEYLPSGKDAPALDQSRMTQRTNDWLDHASKLIEKAWKLGELIGDDAVMLMEEVLAEHKGTHKNEQEAPGQK
jgi:hypothetical protein